MKGHISQAEPLFLTQFFQSICSNQGICKLGIRAAEKDSDLTSSSNKRLMGIVCMSQSRAWKSLFLGSIPN